MSVLEKGLGEETLWSRNSERVQAHYSSIMLHRKCPQAWYFRYGLKIGRPISGPAPYLHYGSWFGLMRTAEALVRGRKLGSLIQEPRKFSPIDHWHEFDMATITPKEVLESSVEWWKQRVASDELAVEEWRKTLGDSLPNRLKGGFIRWRDEYGEVSATERPMAVEMFWGRDLPRPQDDSLWEGADNLPTVRLIGFIDELYEDTDRGMIVVRDNKTTSQMPSMSSMDDMLDSQLQLYAWGVTPALQELGLKPPRAISYDRALSKRPPNPKLNLNGSLSATVKNFDYRTYREWSVEDTRPQTLEELQELAVTNGKKAGWDDFTPEQQEIMTSLPPGRVYGNIGQFSANEEPKFGIYQQDEEVLRRLESPDWRRMFHQRTMTPVNQQVVKAHLRAAIDTATDIWRTDVRTQTTFEATRNLSKDACRWCDYVELCRAQIFGGPEGEYDLREYGLRHENGPILERGEVRAAGNPAAVSSEPQDTINI